ncbi:hypothetical protein RclHR1_04690017 [Rhizophagus clarus]|uniref:MIR domain-containing protein n=1 Tax=Rhizophagus clarus TaxID=94130 RepID=A0A2Z6RIW2_9GLOM|nr:hypothetical protein RclHR1_04690017 [Rhizophagus clarus]GES95035.1 hypothetical protein GLOIN_2v1767369 [Rhizophagus clarus]
MDLPKYNGNIHPDEWINDIQKYLRLRNNNYTSNDYLEIAKTLVDTNISLPTGIDNFEKLRNALREDISFTIFKNTNERKLQSLKYIPESRGGDISKFISNFLKLCYNADINDIEGKKNYLYESLPMNNYFSNEFYKKMKNVNSINELIKEFEDIVVEESNLIKTESIVALKHVATGKYLSSAENFCYITGSCTQLVVQYLIQILYGKLRLVKELATCSNTLIKLQHVKSNDKFLGINFNNHYGGYCYNSPSTKHTEVSCNRTTNFGNTNYWNENWNFNHSKLKNQQSYLKSNDIINLSIEKKFDDRGFYTQDGPVEFLRSHDIQFTIGNDTLQEVVCHNERLGGNDEWCIELIKQHIWTIDALHD